MADDFFAPLTNAIQGLVPTLPSNKTASAGGSSTSPTLPWQGSAYPGDTGVTSVFFPSISFNGSRWDQLLFPYRLLVVDVSKPGNPTPNGLSSNITSTVTPGTSSSIISFTNFSNQWVFELPITPQQLNMQDIFAINTTATLRGILEEHNGVKFKMITANGTMGVWPRRSSTTAPPASPGPLQSLFGGTLAAFGTLGTQIQNVVNVATGNSAASKPITLRPDDPNAGDAESLITTGLYNAQKLQQFLEQYAEAKKNPANAGWRLVFDIPKQNQSLIVTPVSFNWQQNVNKAMEVMYSMQLKAWRRINLSGPVTQVASSVQPISPGILQRILNTISTARSACSAAINLIGAVRSDVSTIFSVLQQTSLLVKDLAGAITTAADLPAQVQTDLQNTIAASLANINTNNLTQAIASNAGVTSAIAAIKAASVATEGLSLNAVATGQLGYAAQQNQAINPAYNVFLQPNANFDLMDQVPISTLALTGAQQNQVSTIIQNASQLTVADLTSFRATIQQLALQLSNNFGTGNAYYSKVYNLPAPTTQLAPITLDDYDLLQSLYDVMQSYDILIATTTIDDNNTQTTMQYVAGLAAASGITFNIPTSKIMAPVPFGLTIEAIALRYLKDPQRWIEIVTLNNLEEPYIDENGFQYPLLSNAIGRQITVGSNVNLYLGQSITLKGVNQAPSGRTITGIETLTDTSFLITFDGLSNLDNFTLANGAYLQAYLPGTVNSQQKIYIPSDLPVPNDANILVPAVAAQDPLTGMSKVDWLLTDSGDLAVNNYGDFRYSYGITNIIQALRIKFGVYAGTWLSHPDFGLGIRPGTINSTIKVQDIYNSINELITNDPRFTKVVNLQVNMVGPTLSISLGVMIAGQGQGVFPVTFQLVS